MSYLSKKFDEDVFISYAHNDDDAYAQEQRGWVTQLHQDLQQRVRNYLGADAQFWRDCEVRNNDDFTIKILKRLSRTAIFLSVLSPSFIKRVWCRRELDTFAEHAGNSGGVLVAEEKSRIFKVEKMPVERDQLPAPMQATKTYKFYSPNPTQPERVHELRPFLGGEYSRRYFEEMDELAKDIATLLSHMALAPGDGDTLPKHAVYLAETTSDLEDKLADLRRDLGDRGYLVLPAADLPYRTNAYVEKVRELLQQSMLSIHLVGPTYGVVPEGETRSSTWLQHDLALQRGAADGNFIRFIWMPGDVASNDERQQQFLAYLREDAGVQNGADLLNGKLEDLKTVVHEKLAELRKQATPASSPSPAGSTGTGHGGVPNSPHDALCVYVICARADRKSPSLIALRKYLISQGLEPILPAESEDEGKALRMHIENLELCDACLIYYGTGSAEWFDAKLSDLRKFLRARARPVVAKAIYIGPETNDDKAEVATLEAVVLGDGSAFAPAALEPMIQKLRAAGSA